MTIDDVIRDFETTGSTLPRASMQWALDHWNEAGPAFIDLLEHYAGGVERSDRSREALFFVIHLLGEKAEARAFGPLCRLLRDQEAAEDVLGDAITETLPQILISTFDGNLSVLKELIENPAAEEWARSAALGATGFLTRIGRIPDDEMRAYLLHLHAELQPRAESPVWVGWVLAVAHLGYDDYAKLVKSVVERFIDPFCMRIEDFQHDLQRTLDDPERMAGFEYDRLRPFEGAIDRLSQWYYFTEKYKKDQARAAADRAVRERLAEFNTGRPYLNHQRKLGRNDPCPCGSGKKYKKCCLGENSPAILLPAAQ
jgi:uncharacterized protein